MQANANQCGRGGESGRDRKRKQHCSTKMNQLREKQHQQKDALMHVFHREKNK